MKYSNALYQRRRRAYEVLSNGDSFFICSAWHSQSDSDSDRDNNNKIPYRETRANLFTNPRHTHTSKHTHTYAHIQVVNHNGHFQINRNPGRTEKGEIEAEGLRFAFVTAPISGSEGSPNASGRDGIRQPKRSASSNMNWGRGRATGNRNTKQNVKFPIVALHWENVKRRPHSGGTEKLRRQWLIELFLDYLNSRYIHTGTRSL